MATNLEDPEAGELWPIEERDPELVAWMRSVGIRPATRSLHRPRYVARRRPFWLAFLLRRADAIAVLGRRLLGKPRKQSEGDLEFEQQLREIWPVPDRESPLIIRPATRSLDRPRYVAKRRPAWLAFLLRVATARD